MGALFYFRKGIRFWHWHDTITSICDIEFCPVGAPLGEEITRSDDFVEAVCKVYIRFPDIENRQIGHFGFRPMRRSIWRPELDPIWNPEGDSLIHRVSAGFQGVEIVPSRYSTWPDWIPVAQASYQLYKKMFVALQCDEAEGSTNECEVVFRWVKGAPTQFVIYPYEEGRGMTQQEYEKGGWGGPRDTHWFFRIGSGPEISV